MAKNVDKKKEPPRAQGVNLQCYSAQCQVDHEGQKRDLHLEEKCFPHGRPSFLGEKTVWRINDRNGLDNQERPKNLAFFIISSALFGMP